MGQPFFGRLQSFNFSSSHSYLNFDFDFIGIFSFFQTRFTFPHFTHWETYLKKNLWSNNFLEDLCDLSCCTNKGCSFYLYSKEIKLQVPDSRSRPMQGKILTPDWKTSQIDPTFSLSWLHWFGIKNLRVAYYTVKEYKAWTVSLAQPCHHVAARRSIAPNCECGCFCYVKCYTWRLSVPSIGVTSVQSLLFEISCILKARMIHGGSVIQYLVP